MFLALVSQFALLRPLGEMRVGKFEICFSYLQKSCFLLGQSSWSGYPVLMLLVAIKALSSSQQPSKAPHLLSCWITTPAAALQTFSPLPSL